MIPDVMLETLHTCRRSDKSRKQEESDAGESRHNNVKVKVCARAEIVSRLETCNMPLL